jgi:hypothetical protein
MSFLTSGQLSELVHFAELSDREIRSDLARGFIRDENDYTSNFTGALRRNINSYSGHGLQATSILITPSEEREMGVDAAIILSRGNESKISVFEAKWPRFTEPEYEWDYQQTASGLSHFSDQLNRQSKLHPSIAVFEMFYCEYLFEQQPDFMQDFGSSCVWHDDAYGFKNHRARPDDIWTQRELSVMLDRRSAGIGRVMHEFGSCRNGRPIRMIDPRSIAGEFRLPPRLLAISASFEQTSKQELE